MAEVTGYIGAEEVILNNAATETTLKQLLTAMQQLAAKTGKGSDADKAVENLAKAMKDGEKESKKLTKAEKQKADQLKKSKESQKAYDEAQERSAKKTVAALDGIEGLTRATVAAANKLTAMVSSVANMGNSFSGAASVLGQVPLVGGLIGPVFGAIGAAGDKVYNSFIQASSVGANFNGSLRAMVRSASDAGLTIDQFTGVIAKNGESLALLGKGTADGAKRLSQLGKIIRTSPIGDDLARLGYSTEEISNGMAQFTGRLAKGGALQNMTTKQIAEVTGQYLKNLDAVSKLTGQSKDALEAQEAARMRDAQYLTFRNKLDAKGQANLEILMKSIPEGMQEGAKEVLATGTATTQAGRDFLAFMNQSGRSLQNLNSVARRSGTITEQQMKNVADGMQAEGKRLAQSPTGEVLGLFVKDVNGMMVAANQYSAQTTNLSGTMEQQAKDAKDAAARGKSDDPAALQKAQQQLAEASNKMTLMLAEHMPSLVSAFQRLLEIIDKYVTPAFQFIAKHIEGLATAIASITGGLILLKGFLKGKQLFDTLFGRGLGTKGNPMHVTMGGIGGPDDMMAGGGKGNKRRSGKFKIPALSAKTAGRLVKGGALVGAAMSAYDAYDTFQDIDEQVAEGKMTEKEATKAKTVAGSKAAGTAAGGYGGAMAGAAIGTAIFPGVGTVIGGAIGGALGAWGGETAAGAAAEALTANQTTGAAKLSADSKKKANDWAWSVMSGKATMSQVPIGLRETVAKILQSPPSNWTKILAGKEVASATPKAPTSAASVSSAQTDMTKFVSDANKANMTEAAQKLDTNAAAAAKEMLTTGTTTKPLTSQETPEQLLASLNNKLDQLIKVSKSNFDIATRQLTVQQGLSGNLHYSA